MNSSNRAELITRLRWHGDNMCNGDMYREAADMLEADVQPQYGWLTACDEEMICAQLGVASLSDSFESAKQKLGELIAWHVAVATDPTVNGDLSLQPVVPQEPKRPDFYQNPTTESWFECPDDADIIEDVDYDGEFVVGTEYELDVCWSGKQRFRVTKIADDESDDIEVECIGGTKLFAVPQPQRPRLSDEEIYEIAKATQSAEPGRDGYILPFTFARAIEEKVRVKYDYCPANQIF